MLNEAGKSITEEALETTWVRFNLVENINIGSNQQAKACTTN